jgi:pimeloyl-ACP methyl ester carboxylesterase
MQLGLFTRAAVRRNATWAALLLLASSSSVAQPRSNPRPPGRMINIDGRMLHLNCTGQGRPTVLLEAGLGDSSVVWALVQPKLATTTRVCSYDRSGTAWSHEAGPQHGLSRAADDLDSLLRISGEHPPYLLVGHSWGGWLITVYARKHLENVAGIVLVDSSVGFDPPVIEKMSKSHAGSPPTGPMIMKRVQMGRTTHSRGCPRAAIKPIYGQSPCRVLMTSMTRRTLGYGPCRDQWGVSARQQAAGAHCCAQSRRCYGPGYRKGRSDPIQSS